MSPPPTATPAAAPPAQLFLDDRDALVTGAIDGLLRASGGRLARLDGFPHIRVVVRADWDRADRDRDRVALVSGGGSGHEPAHAGFVGRGMLTAAVCGDVFASPSVDAVLAGILAVTGPAGCLLVVKNYTGDRLNFGLAAERARAFGHRVEMVVVGDDVALPEAPQPRGVAGTLFVHKVAGALAEAGAPLDEVARAAREVAASARSIGMSLDTCTVPGAAKEGRIPPGRAELGLGIHGEAGIEQVPFSGARDAVARMADRLLPRMEEGPHVLLLNDLGSTTPLEMGVLAEEVSRSMLGPRVTAIIGPAALMTSLDMHGVSLSVLPARPAWMEALRAPAPHAWPGLADLAAPDVRPLPDGLAPIRPVPSPHPGRRALVERCCLALVAAEEALNALDARAGDGDTGTTLATAARALLAALDRLPLADATQLLRAVAGELSQAMGGSSGVLLAILFAAAGDATAGGRSTRDALRAGLGRVMQVGGASLGDRTMVDALAPALDALPMGLAAAARAARAGADATAAMSRAGAGRASYLSADRLLGHNDPGAEGVARLFEDLARPPSATG